LQHRASAWIARLQAAGAGGLHPGIRAGGPATPTSDAARAGATTIIALTIKLDPSVGADHLVVLNQQCVSTVHDIHRATGMPKPTIVRLLETLIAAGFVSRIPDGKGYQVTSQVSALSCGFH